jgi:hypothetical protein
MLERVLGTRAFALLFATAFSVALSIALACITQVLFAQQMQSGTYRIQFDSVNFGGARSTSTTYTVEDTAGEVGSGDSASANFTMRAGYQQMNLAYLSITSPVDVNLANIPFSGGSSNGSAAWLVTTDNIAGYTLSIRASTTPALRSANDFFADYAPGANPSYTWSVSAASSSFGFSPEGVDIHQRFLDNGSSCNTGSSETSDRCWDGFSTVDKIISSRSSSNHTGGGSTTTVKFRAEVGNAKIQTSGSYQATITVTATAL